MSEQPKFDEIIDPDHVPEILCNGFINLHFANEFGVLTFTHFRPKSQSLFVEGQLLPDLIVRARIVLNRDNLRALRDLLVKTIDKPNS